jgi:hypothetical protein
MVVFYHGVSPIVFPAIWQSKTLRMWDRRKTNLSEDLAAFEADKVCWKGHNPRCGHDGRGEIFGPVSLELLRRGLRAEDLGCGEDHILARDLVNNHYLGDLDCGNPYKCILEIKL